MSHEVEDHHQGKKTLMLFWRRRGFQTMCEAGCDVLCWRIQDGQFQFVFSEYDRAVATAVPNCRRNLSQIVPGTVKYLIAVPDERTRTAVRRALRQSLPAEAARRFAITLLSRIEQSLAR